MFTEYRSPFGVVYTAQWVDGSLTFSVGSGSTTVDAVTLRPAGLWLSQLPYGALRLTLQDADAVITHYLTTDHGTSWTTVTS